MLVAVSLEIQRAGSCAVVLEGAFRGEGSGEMSVRL